MNRLLLEDALSGLRRQDPEAWSNLHFLFDFLAGTVSGNRILESQLIIDFDRYDVGTDTRKRAIAMANPGDLIAAKQPSNRGSKRVFFLPSHAWKSVRSRRNWRRGEGRREPLPLRAPLGEHGPPATA